VLLLWQELVSVNPDAAAMFRELQPSQRGLVSSKDWLDYMKKTHRSRGEQVQRRLAHPERPSNRTTQTTCHPFALTVSSGEDFPLKRP